MKRLIHAVTRRQFFHYRLMPLLLPLLCCTLVGGTLDDYGVAWDENVQFLAARSHIRWLAQPSLDTLDNFWRINREHPPLTKVVDGATWWLWHEQLGLLSNIVAFRLGTLVFFLALIWALYRFAAELHGPPAGYVAVASFSLIPQVFYHAHLGALDIPMAAMGLLVLYSYWKACRDARWLLPSAVLLGLALLTKMNAFFLYLPIAVYWFLSFRREVLAPFRRTLPAAGRDTSVSDRRAEDGRARHPAWRAWARLAPMFVIPPLVFFGGWPVLWQDTFRRVVEYLAFHLKHAALPVYYLGTVYANAPWHYPLVMLLLTVPLPILLAMLAGLPALLVQPGTAGIGTRLVQGPLIRAHLLIALAAFQPVVVACLPGVPRYDGLRLLLPALPFWAILAGFGVNWLATWLKSRYRPFFWAGATLLALLTLYTAIVRPHPYQASYYNELIGGIDGAARRGLEPEYWGSSYRGLLPCLDAHPEATFWLYSATRDEYLYTGFELYLADGLLDRPVRFGRRQDSDFVILLIRQGFFDQEMWNLYRQEEPVCAVRLSHTVLAAVYPLPQPER